MKIALFVHSLGMGGAERVAVTLANHWADLGWQVTVVTLAAGGDDRYALAPSVARVALDLASESRGLWSAIAENGRRVRALRRFIADAQPDVVVAMTSTCNALLALAGLGFRGTARVGSERVHPPRVRLARAWHWLRAVSYGWLDAVVAQTAATEAWLLAHTSARRVRVIPNPVVWPLIPREPIRMPASVGTSGRKRVLAVGRLEVQKGFDLLIDAFAAAAVTDPDWELVILGEGPEKETLQRRINAAGLGASVVLAGRVGNIGDWYAAADVFVLSSRFEGFPNVLVEAMAGGLPVIAMDCETGPRDIVRHNVDGLLVERTEAAALRQALVLLMREPHRRAALAAQAVDARTRFSLSGVHAQWQRLFREIAA